MERLTIRLPPGERERLEQLVEDDVFASMGEAVRAGVRHINHEYTPDENGDGFGFTSSYRNNGHEKQVKSKR